MQAVHAAEVLRPNADPSAHPGGDGHVDDADDADSAAGTADVDADVEVLPGIRAVPVAGHTPSSHLIPLDSQGQRLIFGGTCWSTRGSSATPASTS